MTYLSNRELADKVRKDFPFHRGETIHQDTRVWIVACALAFDRHELNKYPQPQDLKDAEIAIASLELNGVINVKV